MIPRLVLFTSIGEFASPLGAHIVLRVPMSVWFVHSVRRGELIKMRQLIIENKERETGIEPVTSSLGNFASNVNNVNKGYSVYGDVFGSMEFQKLTSTPPLRRP